MCALFLVLFAVALSVQDSCPVCPQTLNEAYRTPCGIVDGSCCPTLDYNACVYLNRHLIGRCNVDVPRCASVDVDCRCGSRCDSDLGKSCCPPGYACKYSYYYSKNMCSKIDHGCKDYPGASPCFVPGNCGGLDTRTCAIGSDGSCCPRYYKCGGVRCLPMEGDLQCDCWDLRENATLPRTVRAYINTTLYKVGSTVNTFECVATSLAAFNAVKADNSGDVFCYVTRKYTTVDLPVRQIAGNIAVRGYPAGLPVLFQGYYEGYKEILPTTDTRGFCNTTRPAGCYSGDYAWVPSENATFSGCEGICFKAFCGERGVALASPSPGNIICSEGANGTYVVGEARPDGRCLTPGSPPGSGQFCLCSKGISYYVTDRGDSPGEVRSTDPVSSASCGAACALKNRSAIRTQMAGSEFCYVRENGTLRVGQTDGRTYCSVGDRRSSTFECMCAATPPDPLETVSSGAEIRSFPPSSILVGAAALILISGSVA